MTDADRFEAFVHRFQDRVFGIAVRLLASRADAEDVAQQVFLKAFERFDDLGSNPAAGGWLRTVTTNCCLNHLSRYRARWRFFSELDPEPGEGESFEARLEAPAGPVGDEGPDAMQERLETALARLPDHQRVPLVLFHFEEHSYQHIADLLGVSLSKVKTDIHRGREALRAHLTRTHGPA